MDITILRNKYRSDFLPLNIQKFASGNIIEEFSWIFYNAPYNVSVGAGFNGSYTQDLDAGTTTITVNSYFNFYSPEYLREGGYGRFYLNSNRGAWFDESYSWVIVFDRSGWWTRNVNTSSRTISCESDGTFPPYHLQAYGSLHIDYETYGATTDTSVNNFPAIPAKLGTISNFNQNSTITVPLERFSSNYTKKLIISIGNTTIKTVNNVTTANPQITFTSAEKNIIYNKNLKL